ncbi:class I SAM-dependent methyltransferase [Patulibacter sp.]|uniref:class I SAM-dependent methyltransferase n=1 Tax=Patulibacter sp. TaxID=1912859 RepID=UPI0027195B02|nr:class I SAM-dependent methyltransferase [Patulibacter sp.]MDO9407851.1 class I SAM-dependent methyltransferase [Patulibacter sp.]
MRPTLPAVLDRAHERIFVAGYAWVQTRSEAAGMRETRRDLVSRASGRVLEVGAGTGLNLDHYGAGVTDLTLVEPAPAMREALRAAWADGGVAAAAPADLRVLDGTGEALPAQDGSVDTVVGTFVLCSVDDPAAVLREVARVLRPGGTYLGLEHVRAQDRRVARAQRLVAPGWRVLARGCRCGQDAVALVRSSPLTLESTSSFRGPRQPWPVRPGVRIVARRD